MAEWESPAGAKVQKWGVAVGQLCALLVASSSSLTWCSVGGFFFLPYQLYSKSTNEFGPGPRTPKESLGGKEALW